MKNNLKSKLDYHYKYFDKSKISPDPLEFLHRYKDYHDIEIAGIVSSVFAYGNITQIINTIERLHVLMKHQPYKFILNYNKWKQKYSFNSVKHRFYTEADIDSFFTALHKIYSSYETLKYMFLLYYFEKDKNLKEAVSFFSQHMIELMTKGKKPTHGIKFMFPDPYRGSACKRINLFLRWMVRKDELDFGLWNEISPSQLVIPVDTHVARICKEIGLTKSKNVSWKMAEEITERLKKYDSNDPVKYDFAICHIGMRKMKF